MIQKSSGKRASQAAGSLVDWVIGLVARTLPVRFAGDASAVRARSLGESSDASAADELPGGPGPLHDSGVSGDQRPGRKGTYDRWNTAGGRIADSP